MNDTFNKTFNIRENDSQKLKSYSPKNKPLSSKNPSDITKKFYSWMILSLTIAGISEVIFSVFLIIFIPFFRNFILMNWVYFEIGTLILQLSLVTVFTLKNMTNRKQEISEHSFLPFFIFYSFLLGFILFILSSFFGFQVYIFFYTLYASFILPLFLIRRIKNTSIFTVKFCLSLQILTIAMLYFCYYFLQERFQLPYLDFFTGFY